MGHSIFKARLLHMHNYQYFWDILHSNPVHYFFFGFPVFNYDLQRLSIQCKVFPAGIHFITVHRSVIYPYLLDYLVRERVPNTTFIRLPNLSIVGFLICIFNLGLICFRKNEICLLIKAMESVIEWKKIEKISQSSHVLWITLHYFYYEIKLQNKYIIRIYVHKLL